MEEWLAADKLRPLGPFESVWCKTALAEVGMSLP